MSKENDGGPAFPKPPSSFTATVQNGMSLRDWFAGQAIVGLAMDKNPADMIAEWAYAVADAMLEARTQ